MVELARAGCRIAEPAREFERSRIANGSNKPDSMRSPRSDRLTTAEREEFNRLLRERPALDAARGRRETLPRALRESESKNDHLSYGTALLTAHSEPSSVSTAHRVYLIYPYVEVNGVVLPSSRIHSSFGYVDAVPFQIVGTRQFTAGA